MLAHRFLKSYPFMIKRLDLITILMLLILALVTPSIPAAEAGRASGQTGAAAPQTGYSISGRVMDSGDSYTVTLTISGTAGIDSLVKASYITVWAQQASLYLPMVQRRGNMVSVPAGDFQMGCSPNDTNCATDENPLHTVYLSAYDIDKYEVTNTRYKACVDAGECTAPISSTSSTQASYYGNPTYDNYPVIYVSWNQARAFCAWDGKRLPTEAEWEKAARGASDTRIYPWGDGKPDCSLANTYNETTGSFCVGGTSQVGDFPAGASPYGALDMAGNVWEWVGDWYQSDYYSSQSSWINPTGPASGSYRVLRGGAWFLLWYYDRVSVRIDCGSGCSYVSVGFRCARSR